VVEQHQIASQKPGADGRLRAVAVSDPSLGFLAIADADGDGPTADAACRLATDVVRAHVARNADVLDRFRRHPTDDLRGRIIAVLKEGILRADGETTALASRRSDDLALSFDATLLVGPETFVAHVGGGRVYLARRGLLHRLTVDHLAGDDVPDDVPPAPDEPSATPTHAVPSRALGRGQKPEVEMLSIDVQPGDRIVTATRELVLPMSDVELRDVIAQRPAEDLVSHLLELGRRAGTRGVACGCLQIAGAATKREQEARLEILGRMAMLAHCTPQELVAVASATRPRTYHAGDEIVTEGLTGREMFLVVSGKLEIVKDGAAIAALEPGTTFGEMAMLDEPRASATVRATSDVELLVIAREAFFSLLKTDSTFAVKILWNMLLRLSANLRVTSARLAELAGGRNGTRPRTLS
jgi:CRP-like cAMP-binding protein/serine/threonine protein phosphatase PrpC